MSNIAAGLVVPCATPRLARGDLALIRVGPARWRVVEASGVMLGHVSALDDGRAFRAERYRQSLSGFVSYGEFWDADDAVTALIHSR